MTKEIEQALKLIPPEVIVDAYNDGVQGPLKQAGKFGEQLFKTLRYITYPIQYAAHKQDLIDRRMAEALSDVPEDRRIKPSDSLILEVADKLRFQINDNLVSDMYVDLLSASMDSNKVNLAHPAFIHLISQISRDEALLLLKISEIEYPAFIRRMSDWEVVTKEEREQQYSSTDCIAEDRSFKLQESFLKPEELHYPDNFYMYIDHLNSLELIEYRNNDIKIPDDNRQTTRPSYGFWFIRLSKFGKLFFECCNKSLSKNE